MTPRRGLSLGPCECPTALHSGQPPADHEHGGPCTRKAVRVVVTSVKKATYRVARYVPMCTECAAHAEKAPKVPHVPQPPAYRWGSPYEWLQERARDWDAARLYAELLGLARHLDSDTLQDEYQTDMDKDGYFNKV